MTETQKMEQAKTVFATICNVLAQHQWQYSCDEQALTIACGAQGNDLPMEIFVKVDAARMLTMLISHQPFVVPEDKRLDVAVAVSAVNNMLADGSFDYDIAGGHIFFRMTNSFIDSLVGEELFSYMLFASCQIIDLYNDKFLLIASGNLSVQEFLTSQL